MVPFESKAQMAACFAKDDPKWDCGKWASHTEDIKSLPEKKRYGQTPKKKRKRYGD